jgi:hypothetical protein
VHKKVRALALLAGLASVGLAQAADFGVYATAGTIGFGGGLAATFNDQFAARLGYTTYEYTVEDLEESDLVLDGKAELGGVHAFLDWHPFGGAFRLSVGAIENASLSAHAEPMAGTYTLNGTTYSAQDIGEANATARYDSISPYAGIGFGRTLSRDGRFAFSADLGVVFTGSPQVELNATCAAPNAMLCAEIHDDVAAEEAELQREADELKYWPVIAIGLSYRF